MSQEHRDDGSRIAALEEEVQRLTSDRAGHAGAFDQALTEQNASEQQFEDWQRRWNEFSQEVTRPIKDREVQRAKIEQLEAADTRSQERLARLDEEMTRFLEEEELLEIDKARADVDARKTELHQAEARIESLTKAITEKRNEVDRKTEILDEQRQSMLAARSRLQSMEDLQKELLDKDDQYQAWLIRRGLAHASVLTAEVRVREGWEKAADAVLGMRLTGLGVSDLQKSLADESDLPRRNLFLVEAGAEAMDRSADRLAYYVDCERYDLSPLLGSVYVSESLDDALVRRSSLQSGESIVTRGGILVGRNWIQISGELGTAGGLLQREEEIARLQEEVPQRLERVSESESALEELKTALKDLEAQQESSQRVATEIRETLQSARQRLSDKRARFDQDRKSTRLNSSHSSVSRMPSSA